MTPNQKTGNRKCWHVRNGRDEVVTTERYTRGQAEARARIMGRDRANGAIFRACLDGYHFERCPGQAHDPGNGHVDNCSLCAPRWGVVMVEDK